MKIEEIFVLLKIVTRENIDICVPSDDYYRKGNDWSTDTINPSYIIEVATSKDKKDLLSLIEEEGEYLLATKLIVSK